MWGRRWVSATKTADRLKLKRPSRTLTARTVQPLLVVAPPIFSSPVHQAVGGFSGSSIVLIPEVKLRMQAYNDHVL